MSDKLSTRILVCIGGGPEAYTGLKFVHRLSEESCVDIALLYVRPVDSGLKSGGMEIRVARENVLDWGIELPGMAHLKKAQDILVDLGEISGEIDESWHHHELSGDPTGEFVREYRNACGGRISLRLRTAEDVTTAVVDEADRFEADIIIVGDNTKPVEGLRKLITPRQLSLKIAAHANCSVIVARHLEPGHGHLVCVQNNDLTRAMLPKAVHHAHTCGCPISLLSVAEKEEKRSEAEEAVEMAAQFFRDNGIDPHEQLVEVGDPAEVITELGYDFSLIMVSESEKPWFAKGFSVAHDVAARARNSVMIVK
ncbi:universal stress protein [Pseudodesulfovibrio sp. zrk46]|uniref:universal stress protein n=1 Tax=Pseudodesulfovibrio sp. zrk46 TaxID=2725288 RepID=UPI001449EEE1|nr:universal stress protein [Pseudodesulfovibrio sp. zrk46]QJB56099.1 universal stress protein [Pseudodesulfovibrio sp. zrk46]